MLSPFGAEFRNFMNIWDKQQMVEQLLEEIEHKKNKIKALIDGGPMLLFLKHKENGDIFGTDEPSRVTFARMMHPDEDSPPEWADNANFMATNLSKLLNGGENPSTVFGKKDMKSLDVMDDKDKLIDILVKGMKSGGGDKKIVIVAGNGSGTQLGNDFNEL